jgi:hypothetical protein
MSRVTNLRRLGWPAEAAEAIGRAIALVEQHGTPMNRLYTLAEGAAT